MCPGVWEWEEGQDEGMPPRGEAMEGPLVELQEGVKCTREEFFRFSLK